MLAAVCTSSSSSGVLCAAWLYSSATGSCVSIGTQYVHSWQASAGVSAEAAASVKWMYIVTRAAAATATSTTTAGIRTFSVPAEKSRYLREIGSTGWGYWFTLHT
jgi:hypothetical protein